MKVLRYGEAGVLVEPDDPMQVLAMCDAVAGTTGVIDVVPAARTLLVEFDPGSTSVEHLAELLAGATGRTRPAAGGDAVQLAVRYDGPDLAAVADEVGMSPEEVIRRHSAADYVVAFCGFAPGFAYLTGLDPALRVGRLAQPRTSVPAGSVGVAGEFTGVYPAASPGGWRLLATTSTVLWNSTNRPPALLRPGTTVRFVPA